MGSDLLSRRQPQRSQGLGLEEAFDRRIDRIADRDRIQRGVLLEAHGELRGLAAGQLRERRAAARVRDHAAGMDADADSHADPELALRACAQLHAALHDRQPGAHGGAVVILVRGRIAEQAEDAAAAGLPDAPLERVEDFGASLHELRHQVVQDLGEVVAGRRPVVALQRHDVAADGGQGTPLGNRSGRRARRRRRRGGGCQLAPHLGDGRAQLFPDAQEEPLPFGRLRVMLLHRLVAAWQALRGGQPFAPFPLAGREQEGEEDHAVFAAAGQEGPHLDVRAIRRIEEALADQHQGDVGLAQSAPDLVVPQRAGLDAPIAPQLDVFFVFQSAEESEQRVRGKVFGVAVAVTDEDANRGHPYGRGATMPFPYPYVVQPCEAITTRTNSSEVSMPSPSVSASCSFASASARVHCRPSEFRAR